MSFSLIGVIGLAVAARLTSKFKDKTTYLVERHAQVSLPTDGGELAGHLIVVGMGRLAKRQVRGTLKLYMREYSELGKKCYTICMTLM